MSWEVSGIDLGISYSMDWTGVKDLYNDSVWRNDITLTRLMSSARTRAVSEVNGEGAETDANHTALPA